MKDDLKYHIDVTPEEDALFRDIQPQSNKNTLQGLQKFMSMKTLGIIAIVHLAGVAALYALSPKKDDPVPVQVPEQQPIPTTAPVVEQPSPTPPPPALPPVQPTIAAPPPLPPTITTSYTVKQGDTFYSIVKRYKLNPDVLIKLNNIQDPSKLKTGQVLKFVK
jgi:LysM repeat protein